MQIDILARDFSLTEALTSHIRYRLGTALNKLEDQIQRVRVRLSDINGPRGGEDKQCQLQVVMDQLPDIIIEDIESDMYFAIDRAAERAGRTVGRRVARQRSLSRSMPYSG